MRLEAPHVLAAGLYVLGSFAIGSCSRPAEQRSSMATPAVASAPSPTEAPLAAAAPASYEGMYDVTNCNGIMGWAWDTSRPDDSIRVDIYDGEKRIATMTAQDFREDLKAAGKGNGKHGFTLPTPETLKDGKTHSIVMRFAGTRQELLGDRKELTCRPG